MARALQILACAFSMALVAPLATAADIPDSIRKIVLSARQREAGRALLGGTRFRTLSPFSELPFLAWPVRRGAAPFPREKSRVAAWIRRSARELGHGPFEPEFVEEHSWHGNDVWSFRLVHRGIELYDSRVMVHWRGRRFVGLVNDVPGPLAPTEEPPPRTLDRGRGEAGARGETGERVYYPRRTDGGVELVLARLSVDEEGGRRTVSVVTSQGTVTRLVHPLPGGFTHSGMAGVARPVFTEFAVPLGTFPDQVGLDSSGTVWFSQPDQDFITSFDPLTSLFIQIPISGDSPDGLIVDSQDRAWTGLYLSGALGRLDTTTSLFTSFPAPYSGANPAIPAESSTGTIWVTDHLENRISEFDPSTETWLQSIVMPTPGCWVTAGAEDTASGDFYFTEYNVNQLGRKPPTGPVVDILTPGGGPAFIACQAGKVYYSQWNRSRLGEYDIQGGTFTEYVFPIANENGGPLASMPDGRIVVGTRNVGYIMIFDPTTTDFEFHEIPSPGAGLKDGLTVSPDGVIWFTESSGNKLAKLEFE